MYIYRNAIPIGEKCLNCKYSNNLSEFLESGASTNYCSLFNESTEKGFKCNICKQKIKDCIVV